MRLTVVWHKLFWPSAHSPTGFATTVETESVRQALHEALACGLPVVTTPTSLGRMVEGCGVILQSRTPEALADGVRACLSDPARYRSMSIEALRTAQRYSLERWRDTVRAAIEEAWGPLQPEPTGIHLGGGGERC